MLSWADIRSDSYAEQGTDSLNQVCRIGQHRRRYRREIEGHHSGNQKFSD